MPPLRRQGRRTGQRLCCCCFGNQKPFGTERIGAAAIQKIAEKSKESLLLSSDIQKLMKAEQKSITETREDFAVLSDSIEGTVGVAGTISKITKKLVLIKQNIISNINDLSAISQENTASNEEVTANVGQITDAVLNIAEGIKNMREVSLNLTEMVQYFEKRQ